MQDDLLRKILLPVAYVSGSISESRNFAPSYAAIGGTSGSSCGPGWDRSGEFPFSLFLMHTDSEKFTASLKIFLSFLILVGALDRSGVLDSAPPARAARCNRLRMVCNFRCRRRLLFPWL